MAILVFDFDGVIIDSKRMYVEFIKNALNENGIKIPYNQLEKKLIPSIKKTIENVILEKIENKEKIVEKTEKRVIELTSTKGLDYIKLVKDAKSTLKNLSKNNKIFILSNSHSLFINKVLNSFNLEKYFNEIITLDSGFSSKYKALFYISKITSPGDLIDL